MSVGTSANVASAFGAIGRSQALATAAVHGGRLPMVDAVRAVASTVIVGHHFSSYPPLADAASPAVGPVIDLFHGYGRVANVFIVLSGFMLAASLSHRRWDRGRTGRFLIQRYCRLALPYFAAIGLAIAACWIARDWIDNDVVGTSPTIEQVLAHVFFLQDLLGYESLSTGLWFVCISFQLTIIYVGGLYIRDALTERLPRWLRIQGGQLPLVLGWLFAVASLFYFNLDSSWESWAAFYFGQFFLGVLVYRALQERREQLPLALYMGLTVIALIVQWRIRLALALATGVVLFAGGKLGMMSRWPNNRVVAFMGRTSYSLFLIHFPVLVVVATLWEQLEWTTPMGAVVGLAVAYGLSILVATVFYYLVEEPAARLGRRFA